VLGFAVPQFGDSAHLNVGELARFASTAEQLGADSLWVGNRLLAAVTPTVGYVGKDTTPAQFRTNLDPFIALTAAGQIKQPDGLTIGRWPDFDLEAKGDSEAALRC
jgi:alkanesulfonate monooxygenase SsuD/methylene tetrahydromethanopterin reductase-like flavin-dependent oxidoreductase (luciferase family)